MNSLYCIRCLHAQLCIATMVSSMSKYIFFKIVFPDPGCYNLTKTANSTIEIPDTLLST